MIRNGQIAEPVEMSSQIVSSKLWLILKRSAMTSGMNPAAAAREDRAACQWVVAISLRIGDVVVGGRLAGSP